jgi:23S rRNA (cytosine1962-C5)-methyltransferase
MTLPYALTTVQLKARRRDRFENPAIHSNQIIKPESRIPPGSWVKVVDGEQRWVGYAHYNGHARVALRMLEHDQNQAPSAEWFLARLQRAHALRLALDIPSQCNAYRWVHAEGDCLSGLVIDRFDQLLVTQYYSAGMFKMRAWIQSALDQLLPNAKHYAFADRHIGKQESFDCPSSETPEAVQVLEHGLHFLAAPGAGHKTGFFADQRDNRKYLASLCKDAKVLDLCCNSGGFAIYAKALGHAREVLGVDLDPQVLSLAARNAALNQATIDWRAGNLFDVVPSLSAQYDVVILDPAKMTRSAEGVEHALRTYFAMNKLALSVLKPGGWLLSCSCTGWVSEADFIDVLRQAAAACQRSLQLVRIGGAGADHPILAQAPEGRYLKAIFARVV